MSYEKAAQPDELDNLEAEAMAGEVVDEAETETDQSTLGSEACAALAQTAFQLVAMRRGDHWALSNEEAEAVGGALDQVLEKYLPGLGGIGPEASLALMLAAVVMPRLQKDKAQDEAASNGEG